jgi:hypothetical protein
MRNDDTERPLEARIKALAAFGEKLTEEGRAFDVAGGSGEAMAPHAWDAVGSYFVEMAYANGWCCRTSPLYWCKRACNRGFHVAPTSEKTVSYISPFKMRGHRGIQ